MNKLDEWIAYLQEQLANHSIYVWGAQGQKDPTVTEAWIRKVETSVANANKAVAYWKKQVAAGFGKVLRAVDCSGLGMYYLYNIKRYFSGDLNANGMKGKCKQITNKSQLKRGDWVFKIYTSGINKGRAYHIGYIVDNDLNIIEAKGRAYGVVKSKFSSEWNWWGRPDIFKAEIENSTPPITPVTPTGNSYVEIVGNAVNIRTANNVNGDVLGIARRGAKFPFVAETATGWYQINYNGNTNAFISNRLDLTKITSVIKLSISRVLKKGMSGSDARLVKQWLFDNGWYDKKITQITNDTIGGDSDKAIRKFQSAMKLKVDGEVGANTITAMGGKYV